MNGPRMWLTLLGAMASWLLVPAAVQAASEPWDCQTTPLCDHQTDTCVASDFGCPQGYVFVEGAAACGCCGGCVEAIPGHETCKIGGTPCEYGYTCVGKKDPEDEGKIIYTCEEGECTKKQDEMLDSAWTPTCKADGSYAAVQCKGLRGVDGRCFCWSPEGERLYGFASWGQASDKMDCACSLKAWALAKETPSRAHEAPRCTMDGSYDTLQCSAGVCWCADQQTGQPLGRVVPQSAITMLVCYNMDDVGLQYRRVCDSELDATSEMSRTFLAHGGASYGIPNISCDLDGGYGPVQKRNSGLETYCSKKDKTIIPSYYQDASLDRAIDCKCARDVDYFGQGLPCYPNGNYVTRRLESGIIYCYDSDGFYSYPLKDIATRCPNEYF